MESFFWRGLEKLEVVYCVGKVAKGRRWGWSGVVGSPGGGGLIRVGPLEYQAVHGQEGLSSYRL